MGFIDDFKEWSTIKKLASILVVCCIGLIIFAVFAGGLSPDKNTSTDANGTSAHASGIQVKITYDGSWSGNVGTAGSISSYDGTGDKTIDVNGSSFDTVSAAIQKQDGSSSELKVQIIKDGKVVKESSTTAEYGVVTITK